MITQSSRMTIRDSALVFCSTAVVALALTPTPGQRQTISRPSGDGGPQTYSLAVDDPRLERIELALSEWQRQPPDRKLATARWAAATADFYAQQTSETTAGLVLPVSYAKDPKAIREANQRQIEHQKWQQLANVARSESDRLERQIARDPNRSQVPIVIGNRINAGLPGVSFAIAFCLAALVTAAFMLWTRWVPALGVNAEDAHAAAHQKDDQLRLEIPADWIRVHQPILVRLRQLLIVALVACALVCIPGLTQF